MRKGSGMSGQQNATKPARSKRDRFDLPHPPRGVLRGIIRNIRRTNEEGPFGALEVIEFDLHVSDTDPPVPVVIRGNDYSRPLFADCVADIADPDPTIRPLRTRRMTFPHQPDDELIAYYPGLDDPNTPTDRFWSIVMIIGPIVGSGLTAGLIGWYFGLFH